MTYTLQRGERQTICGSTNKQTKKGSSMNYFSFHVGDFVSHTTHLSNVEELAYRRMIDLYYLTEKPLPNDPALIARKIRLRKFTKEVEQILAEFFTTSKAGFRNKRCDEEILKYKNKITQASSAGKSSAISRKQKKIALQQTLNIRSTAVQPTKNQNQEPKKERKKEKKKGLPTGVLTSMREVISRLPSQVS